MFYKFRELINRYRENIKVEPSIDFQTCGSLIAQALQSKAPYLVGRIGWMEGYAIGKLLTEGEVPLDLREKLMLHAGIFPATLEQLKVFADIYLEAFEHADILGLLNAPYHGWLIKKYAKSAKLASLEALEPYFSEQPWSEHLQGLRVLVVDPFAESIVKQYRTVREKIFKNPKILPLFELKVIKSPQTITGNIREYTSWAKTLHVLKQQVQQEEFDAAIIGCGAYGLPLAAAIKKMGKTALHLGGATQLLFGVRGGRWDQNPSFQPIMTDAWAFPLESERPIGWEKIEKG